MNNISLAGIAINKDHNDDRTKLFLSVVFNGETFDWQIRMPPSFTGSFQEFINSQADKIYADIGTKIQQWEQLEPKTKTIEFDGEVTVINIEKKDIVQPTYPDYYVLRAQEYPKIAEQLDAIWKDEETYQTMKNLILSIKQRYPK